MPSIGFGLGTPMGRLSAQDMGVPDYVKALSSGLSLGAKPAQLTEQLLGQTLQNKINQAKAQYAQRNEAANLANTQANTGLTSENTYKQQILNSFLNQREPAEIAEIKARSNYYSAGGPGSSTGSRDYQAYVNGVMQDNPNLTPEQLKEAADVLAKGGDTLIDGTKLNAPSFGTQLARDRAVKAGTTAAQINQSNSANQADAELDVMTQIANKLRQPYGTTYFGYSPKQIAESFKSDDKSQADLGKLVASNAIEFDLAQIRNRIGMGQPGITSTNQMIEEAQQHIKTLWPRLSQKARSVANDELNKALKAGLAARNKVGVGAGGAYTRQFGATPAGQPSINNEAPPGSIGLYKNGNLYYIPADQADEAISEGGFSYE